MNQQPGSFPPASPMRPTTPPPTPPPPEITLRTMQSDMESLKQTGGSGSAPKPFTPPELAKDLSRPAVPPPPMPRIPQTDFATQRPAAPSMPSVATPKIETEAGGSNWKKMLLWGGALVLIIGAGVAGYLYVYPMLFPPARTAPPAPALTTPPVIKPEAAMPPASIGATNTPVTATNTPGTAGIPAQQKIHKSLLASATGVSSINLTSIDMVSLKLALQAEAQKTAAPDSLIETTLSDANGQIAASSVLPLMLPTLTAETMKKLFEDDFTTALYHDANSVWPVYILMINAASSQVEAQPAVTGLETSANLSNLFLSAPGAQSAAGFKSGKIGGINTRYVTFSKTGASLNIAWSGNKLVLSTSYNGMKKTLSGLTK